MATNARRGLAQVPVFAPAWRIAKPRRCDFGACYLFGASLPTPVDSYEAKAAAAHGCRQPKSRLIPCPQCGHLPERVDDPGPLPRLRESAADNRLRGCVVCGAPVRLARQRFCSAACFNKSRQAPGLGSSPRSLRNIELPVHRVFIDHVTREN